MKTTTIIEDINCLQNEAGAKKIVCKDNSTKKNVCVDEMSIPPPSKKIMVRPLYGFDESCILIGRRAVRKNPYSDRGP